MDDLSDSVTQMTALFDFLERRLAAKSASADEVSAGPALEHGARGEPLHAALRVEYGDVLVNGEVSSMDRAHQLQRWIDDVKHEMSCYRCGQHPHPAALGFHHTNPAMRVRNVSQCRSRVRAVAGMQKCVVICANCHAIHEAERKLRERRPRQQCDMFGEDYLAGDWHTPIEVRWACGCDQTLRHTIAFIDERGIDKQPALDWLESHSGYCDCEVLLNSLLPIVAMGS